MEFLIPNKIRRLGIWACQRSRSRIDYRRSKILILCPPNFFFGNAILLEPAIRMLRRNLPDAHLSLLGTEAYCNVFEPTGLVDHAISWDLVKSETFGRFHGFPFWQHDIVFETYAHPFLPTTAEWAIACRCELWMTRNLVERLRFDGLHETDESLNVVACKLRLPTTEEDRVPELHLTTAEQMTGKKIVEKYLNRSRPFIGFHPGSVAHQTWKRWPADSFVTLGTKAIREFGATICLFGGPDEIELNELISKHIGKSAVNLTMAGTFRETAAAIAHCDAFVSNDSALMNAANAVKTPVVAIFGPTSPEKNRPIGDSRRIRILTPSTSCANCYIRNGYTCPETCKHRKCLESIGVDVVLGALNSLLSGSRR